MSEASGKEGGGKKKSRRARHVGRDVEGRQPVKAGFFVVADRVRRRRAGVRQ